jgi:hypothetical protein
MKRRHSASGQNAKYSSRTDVFRFGSELGHCPTVGTSHLCQQVTLTEGALPAVCLFGTGLYAAVVRVLKIGLAVCPLLARVCFRKPPFAGPHNLSRNGERAPVLCPAMQLGLLRSARSRSGEPRSRSQAWLSRAANIWLLRNAPVCGGWSSMPVAKAYAQSVEGCATAQIIDVRSTAA